MAQQSILEKKLAKLFPDPGRRAAAGDILAGYPAESQSMDPQRVRLAALKLAGSDLEKLRAMVSAANGDPRDVIAWAEYPEKMRRAADSAEAREIVERDRRQYEAWLDEPSD